MGEAAARIRNLKHEFEKKALDYNANVQPGLRIAWAQREVLRFVVGSIACGKYWQTHANIAKHVHCCAATVQVALRNCARAGLISWTPVWHWNSDAARVTQWPNVYRFGSGIPSPIPGRRKTQDSEISSAPESKLKKEDAALAHAREGLSIMKGALKLVRTPRTASRSKVDLLRQKWSDRATWTESVDWRTAERARFTTPSRA